MKIFNQQALVPAFVLLLLAILGGVSWATVGAKDSPEATPAAQEQGLQWSASSPDGLSVFSLSLRRPWDEAQARILTFNNGYVTTESLAGLESSLTTDLGAGSEPLITVGDRYQCTASLVKVGSWKEVRSKADVALAVTPVAK